jgi:flagellar basal body rod protein FlgG
MGDLYGIVRLGLDAGRERLEAIGLNSANAARPGYRRVFAVESAMAAGEAAAARATAAAGPSAPTGPLRSAAAGRPVDLRPAALLETGRTLDLAIEGEGLFFALTDGARTWLTRAGAFRLDAEGTLVNEGGLRLVGRDGDVRLEGEDVEVLRDGQVMRQGIAVAALQLFRPADPAELRSAGGTLLDPGSSTPLPAEPGAGRLRSGALEASNADPAHDLVELVALSRQFEGLARIAQGYDELLGRAIRQLGEV